MAHNESFPLLLPTKSEFLSINTSGAQPGDTILLSKGIPIEGTSVIARERGEDLLAFGISRDLLERAKHLLFDPGLSVLDEARAAF